MGFFSDLVSFATAGLVDLEPRQKKVVLPPGPKLPDPSDAEVLAADLRMRRALQGRGRSATVLTGGLAGRPAPVTLPSLIGLG